MEHSSSLDQVQIVTENYRVLLIAEGFRLTMDSGEAAALADKLSAASRMRRRPSHATKKKVPADIHRAPE